MVSEGSTAEDAALPLAAAGMAVNLYKPKKNPFLLARMVMPAAIFMRFLSDAGMEKNIHMRGNIGNSSPKTGSRA